MSKSKQGSSGRAVALQYGPGSGAPVIVASGMGHLAERIVEVAVDSGVPVYEDNSLATILSQMELGREIPEELYQKKVPRLILQPVIENAIAHGVQVQGTGKVRITGKNM